MRKRSLLHTCLASLLLGTALWPLAASATVRLTCHATQGGSAVTVVQSAVATPYAIAATPVGGTFRFKAVVLGTPERVEQVMLYTYALRGPQAVLLHEAVYTQPPVPSPQLTGEQIVIEPGLGRDLHYRCALTEEVAP